MRKDQRRAIDAYLRTRPQVKDPTYAANKCRVIVQGALALKTGTDRLWIPDAREVWLIGHRTPTPLDPPRSPLATDAEHAVLLVGDQALVDLTRRQYDPEAEVPTIYERIDEAGRHWRWFVDSDDVNAPQTPLNEHAARPGGR